MRWIVILWMFCVAVLFAVMPFIAYNRLCATTTLFREVASVSETESSREEERLARNELLQSVTWFENLTKSPFLIVQFVFMLILSIANFIAGLGLLLRKDWSAKVALLVLTASLLWHIGASLERELYYRPAMATHIRAIYHSTETLTGRQIPMKPELLKAFKLSRTGISAIIFAHCLGIAILGVLFYNRNSILKRKTIIKPS